MRGDGTLLGYCHVAQIDVHGGGSRYSRQQQAQLIVWPALNPPPGCSMDPAALKTVGEIAGAGGVILCLVIVFFRSILTSKLSQKLTRLHAARTVNLLIGGVLVLAAAGIVTAYLAPARTKGCSSNSGDLNISQGQHNTAIVTAGCGRSDVKF
jgi:hypothetical protein